MAIQKILVADDDFLVREFVKTTLTKKNFDVITAENGKIAIDLIKKNNFDLIITDMKMPETSGLDILKFIKAYSPDIPVIIMTAHGTIENAVEAMHLGAFNYIIKPFTPTSLEMLIDKAQKNLMLVKENQYLRDEISSLMPNNIIANSPSMKKIINDLDKIAKSDACVFISGESGTGKEVIAQAIHNFSSRKNNPYIKVNCAAISENLLESEFFGHEKGAFTGADQKKIGRFELADTGSLLLDEITEIPLTLQPKLLRVLQELEFERVGGIKSLKINVRFIATSNRDMTEAIKSNIFREDLYFRLNVMPITLPPLRDRKEDILPLAAYYLEKFCKKYHKTQKNLLPKAKNQLINYPWPGNIRELANLMERTVVLDLGNQIENIPLNNNFLCCTTTVSPQETLPTCTISEMEKILIQKTLQEQKNNKTKTAKILGISLKTLRNKLNQYNNH